MMGWYVGDHMTGWGWVGMMLSTILFVGLLLFGGLLLVRATRQPDRGPTPPSPEQLLAERFARGDIDEEEYRRRLATLTDAGALRRLRSGRRWECGGGGPPRKPCGRCGAMTPS